MAKQKIDNLQTRRKRLCQFVEMRRLVARDQGQQIIDLFAFFDMFVCKFQRFLILKGIAQRNDLPGPEFDLIAYGIERRRELGKLRFTLALHLFAVCHVTEMHVCRPQVELDVEPEPVVQARHRRFPLLRKQRDIICQEILQESDHQVVVSDHIYIVLYVRVYKIVLESHIAQSLPVKPLLQQVKTSLKHLPVIRKTDS